MTVVVPIGNAKPAPEAMPERVGVLLVNLGTPDGADAASVRRYLKEFLSDPRVIEDQGLLWKLILNGIILRVRPARKARRNDSFHRLLSEQGQEPGGDGDRTRWRWTASTLCSRLSAP